MNEYLPSVFALGTIALVALFLAMSRGAVVTNDTVLRQAVRVAAIAVATQAVHFVEELTTGFHERFPAAFGLAPMSLSLFVSFNVAWLVIWMVSAWGLARRSQAALFPLWFLGIAGVVNGIAHPLLALNAQGYFPGVATSTLVAVACALLLARLSRVTA